MDKNLLFSYGDAKLLPLGILRVSAKDKVSGGVRILRRIIAMKTEFDDALRGMYRDYDEVHPQEEDQYRAIGSLSVFTFVFGLASALAFFSWTMLIVPVAGLVVGFLAIQKILAAPTIMGGLRLTVIGLILSFVFGVCGAFTQYYSYYYSVPAGYIPIAFVPEDDYNYPTLAADRKSDAIPQEIQLLDNQRVFIQGYVHPSTKEQTGLTKFALVRILNPSGFSSATLHPTDMVLVELKNGQTISYRTKPIRIGGVLHVRTNYSFENLPYMIEADVVR
ncbi:MAG: hypothetical protein LBT05_15670 [Planctomycetaceae bacterium]|jgi:hypothetical protein|nr:hypothetical protein [Planctomycetaceae bacterium]